MCREKWAAKIYCSYCSTCNIKTSYNVSVRNEIISQSKICKTVMKKKIDTLIFANF